MNPNPEKFYTLPEAFDALGHVRFGKKWRGDELASRNLPPPKETFLALEHAKQALNRAQIEKVQKAKKASMGVGAVTRVIRRPTVRTRGSVAREVGVSPEVADIATNRNAYRKEYRARSRRNEVERELRTILYETQAATILLNAHDGVSIDIPSTHWIADKFSVDFVSGQAGWIDPEDGQPITNFGTVLIDRQDFDRVLNGPQQSSMRAETECHGWARNLVRGKQIWRKTDFIQKAMEEFPGLSQNGAIRVWELDAPKAWKRPGRKS